MAQANAQRKQSCKAQIRPQRRGDPAGRAARRAGPGGGGGGECAPGEGHGDAGQDHDGGPERQLRGALPRQRRALLAGGEAGPEGHADAGHDEQRAEVLRREFGTSHGQPRVW